MYLEIVIKGEVAERLKAHAWKACIEETLSWVRIPFSPPYFIRKMIFLMGFKEIEKKSKKHQKNVGIQH